MVFTYVQSAAPWGGPTHQIDVAGHQEPGENSRGLGGYSRAK